MFQAKVSFNQKGQPSMQLQMSKPCDNFVMKGILTSLYDMNEKCIIKKVGLIQATCNVFTYYYVLFLYKFFTKACSKFGLNDVKRQF